MSLQLLFKIGLAGVLLSIAAYLGLKVRPGLESPIVLAARVMAFGVVAVIWLLCVAENLQAGPSPEAFMEAIATRIRTSVDSWLSLF